MESNTNHSVFVVVLNYNNFSDSSRCIKSLLECSYDKLSIVIVDNASSDNSVSLLRTSFPQLEFILSEKNGGYAHGMNLGAKYALEKGAEFIMLLNNDTVVEKSFFEPIIELALSDKKIGIISPKVAYLSEKDKLYCGGGEFSLLLCGGVAKYQGKSFSLYANAIREITNAEGCCMFIRREVFAKVGYMDEKYFMYFEEVEYSQRVLKHFKIFFHNKAIIYHNVGAGKKWEDFSALYYYYYTRNRFWFFDRYGFIIKVWVIIFALINSLAKSLFLIKAYLFDLNNEKYISSFNSLWKGFYDGLVYLVFDPKSKQIN